jgi:hypothetical protein
MDAGCALVAAAANEVGSGEHDAPHVGEQHDPPWHLGVVSRDHCRREGDSMSRPLMLLTWDRDIEEAETSPRR